ncbi:hypothetical protein DFH29DRAFT_921733 [Suillus ampliporus]|nr:hypothetical protein DFH29DRAFT_921733 [Suillus ampliporus]
MKIPPRPHLMVSQLTLFPSASLYIVLTCKWSILDSNVATCLLSQSLSTSPPNSNKETEPAMLVAIAPRLSS